MVTVAEHQALLAECASRQRLLAIYELRSAEAEAKMVALRAWCALVGAGSRGAVALCRYV